MKKILTKRKKKSNKLPLEANIVKWIFRFIIYVDSCPACDKNRQQARTCGAVRAFLPASDAWEPGAEQQSLVIDLWIGINLAPDLKSLPFSSTSVFSDLTEAQWILHWWVRLFKAPENWFINF